MKKCIYTANIGNYDHLYTSVNKKKTAGWDYICFTDNPSLKSDFWNIRVLEKTNSLDNSKFARNIKLNWHKYVDEYDVHIWKDTNIEIACNLDKYYNFLQNYDMVISKHWQRNCAYNEAKEVVRLEYANRMIVEHQMNKYNNEKYPIRNGLVETGLIIRKNNQANIDFSNTWWNEVLKHSHRDQLSFNYSLWKNPIKVNIIKSPLRNNSMFRLKPHITNTWK